MNFSNMIEEKHLKKTFIVATLCSTLVGTFSSSIGLWDKMKERRKQFRKDAMQDEEIKKLKSQLEHGGGGGKEKEKEQIAPGTLANPCNPGGPGGYPAPMSYANTSGGGGGGGGDDVGRSFQKSGALIQREFEDGLERMGRRFAEGDAITENKLQAQVIAMQQTVIGVLQNALAQGRQLDRRDMERLMDASDAAREGSIEALRQQRLRMMEGGGGDFGGGAGAAGYGHHNMQHMRSLSPPKQLKGGHHHHHGEEGGEDEDGDGLFCRYSLDLQRQRTKPMAASFAPGGSCRCPACGTRVGAEPDDFWAISKRGAVLVSDPHQSGGGGGGEREVVEEREFHLGQRFVIKCHTASGEYACVLCSRHRDSDALCRSVESLVNHVGRFHDVAELEREFDFTEVKPKPKPQEREQRPPRMLALPAPPPPPPAPTPPQSSSGRVREVEEYYETRERRQPIPVRYR